VPRSQDEVDAGSGTGSAEKSLPLQMEASRFCTSCTGLTRYHRDSRGL